MFNGTSWVALGSSSLVAGSSGVTSNYALATDGTHVAVAFSTATSYGSVLTILQSSGGAFSALPSPIKTPVVAGDNSFSTAPTLAYSGGALFVAWVQEDPTTLYLPRVYASSLQRRRVGGGGKRSGERLRPYAAIHRLRSAEARRRRRQADARLGGDRADLGRPDPEPMSMTWNKTKFAAVQPPIVTGTGIGEISTRARTLELTLDPNGRPWLAVDTTDGTGLQIYAGEAPSTYFVAGPQHTIASILASGQVKPGSLIIVAGATGEGTINLGASADGVAIVGLDGVSLSSVVINGATNVTLRNLDITGGVSITNTSGVTLAENTIGGLTLSGATGLFVRNNTIAGVSITSASGGAIRNNSIDDAAIGLDIGAAFSGLISDNAISGLQTAVVYAAAAALANNRIFGSPVGVSTAISNPATLFGAVAGSTPNIIEDNAVGVELTNAQVINQTIRATRLAYRAAA